jgi:membrane protease YdiL (CAAX protease family)
MAGHGVWIVRLKLGCEGRISRMDGQVTSPQSPGVWKQFGAFVRRPQLPERATGIRLAALPPLGKLFVLDLLLMALLIGAAAAASVIGLEMPEHLLDQLELTAPLLLFILVLAPLGEELIFRGWLTGRPGQVGAFVAVLAGALGMAAAGAADQPLVGLSLLVAGLLVAIYLLWRKRGRPPMPFFAGHFRWFYFGSTLAFASVHLANFTEGNALVLLPLTLPQFLLGLILGYARVNFGLWASVLLHMAHNSLFVGLLLAGAG